MGALHQGHLSLIRRSVEENDRTVVSIAGVDILFMPEISSMYGKDEVKLKAPEYLGYILEGNRRPGHFDGVVQVVMKLFGLVAPRRAYFGKKDAQQLVILQKMVEDLFLPVEIVPVDTVREEDGLALSSRNVYLTPQERKRALCISRSLKSASRLVMAGEYECEKITEHMLEIMKDIEVEYVRIVDRSFRPLERVEIQNSIILVAARVGGTRLIDNLWI